MFLSKEPICKLYRYLDILTDEWIISEEKPREIDTTEHLLVRRSPEFRINFIATEPPHQELSDLISYYVFYQSGYGKVFWTPNLNDTLPNAIILDTLFEECILGYDTINTISMDSGYSYIRKRRPYIANKKELQEFFIETIAYRHIKHPNRIPPGKRSLRQPNERPSEKSFFSGHLKKKNNKDI